MSVGDSFATSLLATKDYLNTILQSMTDSLIVIDPDSIIRSVNPASLALLGYTEQELIGHPFSKVLPDPVHGSSKMGFKELVQQGPTKGIEKRYQTKNGKERWVLFSSSLLQTQVGDIQGIVCLGKDITDQKKAEASMRKAQDLQIVSEIIQKTISDAILITNADSNIYAINDAASNLLGYVEEELVGQPISKVIFEEETFQVNDLNTILQQGNIKQIPRHFRTKTGTRIPVLLSGSTVSNQATENLFFICAAQDVSKLKAANESLELSRASFYNIVERSADGILVTDEQGQVTYINSMFSKLFGFSREEMVGKPHGFPHVVDEESTDIGIIHKDGSLGTGEIFSSETLWDGKKAHLLSIRDITERKRQEEQIKKTAEELRLLSQQLEESNATKDQFFSIISHDLRSPLAPLLRLTEMLMDDFENFAIEEIQEIIQRLHRSGLKLNDLLDKLLQWAQIQNKRLESHLENLDLHPIANELIDLFSEKARIKSIQLFHEIPPHTSVLADKYMLNTILQNLISNALKFTPQGGNVQLTAAPAPTPTDLEIAVTDNGIGIPQDSLEKMFNIAIKYTRKGTEGEMGTGLGLSLCKEFAEAQGGTLTVTSSLERGSTFSLTLSRSPHASTASLPQDKENHLANKAILIVEDDPENQFTVNQLLKKMGCDCETASNGKEALEKLRQSSYHLVLMDLNMPEMNGFEASHQILQEFPPPQRPKLIAWTSQDDAKTRQHCLDLGMDDLCSKNLSYNQLIVILKRWLYQEN